MVGRFVDYSSLSRKSSRCIILPGLLLLSSSSLLQRPIPFKMAMTSLHSLVTSASGRWALLISLYYRRDILLRIQGGDPTHGYVNYVDQVTAQNTGLIDIKNNQVYLGVDKTNSASDSGRSSVRLTSTASYNHGLFILDLAHMPGSVCGTWPAL